MADKASPLFPKAERAINDGDGQWHLKIQTDDGWLINLAWDREEEFNGAVKLLALYAQRSGGVRSAIINLFNVVQSQN